MQPTPLDVKIIHLLAPIQKSQFWVDTVDILTHNSLVNGFVFIVPLALYWSFSGGDSRRPAQRLVVTIHIATIIGCLSSLGLQQVFCWPSPASHPELGELFAPQFRYGHNPNSFPSDSTMLFSTVVFGVAAWSRWVSAGLLAWLLLFTAPLKLLIGGHYASDIFAGLLVGYLSILVARQIVRRIPAVERLSSNESFLFRAALLLWMFEVGNGFHGVSALVRGAIHVQRHL